MPTFRRSVYARVCSRNNSLFTKLGQLCKDHGVKANLKTETLIELLQQCASCVFLVFPLSATPGAHHSVSADPGSSRRRVPTRSATRGLERSNSQMSLDDLDPENDENAVPYEALSIEPQPPKQEPESEPEPVQTRSKKANQLTKLGVGRPMAAGGSGARSPSKPPATTKKATRASRSLSHDQSPPEDHRPAIKPSGHRSGNYLCDILVRVLTYWLPSFRTALRRTFTS